MIQLHQLIPTNLVEEKAKFFADTSSNPQFKYSEPVPSDELTYYGKPEQKLLALATHIADTHSPLYMLRMAMKEREEPLSNEAIRALTEEYLQDIGLADRYNIEFKENAVSRCSIKAEVITFRKSTDYISLTLAATLNHELGTHALRRVNDEKQPWHGKRRASGFQNHLLTEEGLAILHQQLEHRIPTLYNSAVRYLAVAFTLQHSFAELWQWLTPLIRSDEKRWSMCFRAKRGLTDTSQNGGFTKDLTYFSGAYYVSQWLANHDFDLPSLYLGRIAIEDVERAKVLTPNTNITLPTFFSENPIEYATKIQRIRAVNDFV